MKKKNIFACAAIALASFGFTACSDILDQDPLDSFSDAAVWSDLNLAESFLNNCYRYVEAENSAGVMFANYTDEAYHMHDYGTSNYTQGHVNPDNINIGWTEGKGNTWQHYYNGIKLCNQLLERIEETPAETESDKEWKNQIIGQAYFLRAFYYHYLYGFYGRVPLIDHTYGLNDEIKETRADMDDVANFIIEDLDKAAELLPVEYSTSNLGRATKGAAMALKGRVLLWKASPLFGTPSKEKWEAAAAANKALIDLGVYSLQSVSNSDEYADLFLDKYNPEVIFMMLYDEKAVTGFSNSSCVMQTPAGPGNGFEGWSTWQPTYEIVNVFQNADGTPYVPAETKPYKITTYEYVWSDELWQDVLVATPTTIQATEVNPWENREIRLDANILYDGSMWGYGEDHRAVELFEAGEDGVTAGKDSRTGTYWWNGTKSGYNMKKFLNSHFDFYGELWDTTPWFFLRLAEVYLNYAECMIELGQDAEALKYINIVRQRALLPPATGKDIEAEYRYERTVELMFEGQRFFDLRRWKELENYYNVSENWPTGMKIYKMKDGTKLYYHNPEPLQERAMDPSKNYWLPVPRYELNRCPDLDAAPYE